MLHCGNLKAQESQDFAHTAKVIGGHIGINTLQTHLRTRFFWPRMNEDAQKFVRSCERCQRIHQVKIQQTKKELHPVKIPSEIWTQVGIDLISLPMTNGYNHALTAIDYFTKWVEIYPLKGKSARVVAEALFDLMMRWGPAKIHITGTYSSLFFPII